MTMKKTYLIAAPLLASVLLLAGCSGSEEPTKPAPSATETEKPAVVYPEVVENDYEAVEVSVDEEFPLAAQEFELDDDGYFFNAQAVNMPETERWVKQKVSEGWTIARESNKFGFYNAILTRGEDQLMVDVVQSEEAPFTSIMLVPATEDF